MAENIESKRVKEPLLLSPVRIQGPPARRALVRKKELPNQADFALGGAP